MEEKTYTKASKIRHKIVVLQDLLGCLEPALYSSENRINYENILLNRIEELLKDETFRRTLTNIINSQITKLKQQFNEL